MAGEDSGTWAGEVASAFFSANLAFYDKSPVVASIGYLFLTGSLPLYLLLRFAAKLKKLDNEKVIAKFNLEAASRTTGSE